MSQRPKTKKPLCLKLIIILSGLLLVGLIGFSGYFLYSYYNSLPANQDSYRNASNIKDVKLVEKTNYYELLPKQPGKVGLILYPGAFAEPKAYLSPFAGLAQRGFTIFIIKSPLNFALLNPDAAKPIIQSEKQIDQWYVAGHSLGGVTACEFSKSNQNLIRGLVLLGSYCNGNATNLNIPVLSIFATNDGLTTTADIEKSRLTLPPNSVFVEVAGGNHTQFGSFAKLQPGDQPANVSEQVQAEQVSKAILNFINR
jgi:hypothetical protein